MYGEGEEDCQTDKRKDQTQHTNLLPPKERQTMHTDTAKMPHTHTHAHRRTRYAIKTGIGGIAVHGTLRAP